MALQLYLISEIGAIVEIIWLLHTNTYTALHDLFALSLVMVIHQPFQSRNGYIGSLNLSTT